MGPREYGRRGDFELVRRFLVETYKSHGGPRNWMIDRWNFCVYHVGPLHTYYSTRYFSVPTRPHVPARDEPAYWRRTVRLWEEGGSLEGAVLTENEEPGEAWIQTRPDREDLIPEMLDVAERELADRADGWAYLKAYADEGTALEALLRERGYRMVADSRIGRLRKEIVTEPVPDLPEGFRFSSAAKGDDLEKRRRAKAIAFGGNYRPSAWPPASAFAELAKAPDYRPELDIFIEAPDGEMASFCTIWLDEENGYANFEPVGTRAEYQGMGLGRALLLEGFRLMRERGVRHSHMESRNEFYRKLGFEPTGRAVAAWWKYL